MDQAELDIEQPGVLARYLVEHGHLDPAERVTICKLTGGVSNRTMLVRRGGGRDWVVKQALRQLRVQARWISDPARIEREAQGLRHLHAIAPPGAITPLIFLDESAHILAMQAVPEPHDNWKSLLLAGRIETDHVEQFARLLGVIHRAGWQRRQELSAVFAETRYFQSLRLEPYYGYAAEQCEPARPFLEQLIRDTRPRRDTLVHGDYSPKNILIHDGRLILLDHEVIHFGDAAFDLGFSLTHLLSKAHYLPAHRQRLTDAARLHWDVYRRELGDVPFADGLDERVVRHTLGCLLARVEGRSPLEYLDAAQRSHQRRVVVDLMQRPPDRVPALIDRFHGAL